jgi:hypothetical protein
LFADHYKNDDFIIGTDFKNKPHGKCDEGDHATRDDSSNDFNRNMQLKSSRKSYCQNSKSFDLNRRN